MIRKHSNILLLTIVYIAIQANCNEEEYSDSPVDSLASPSRLLSPAINLTSFADSNENVLVLIPSGINLSEFNLNDGDFNLFKLNTDVLLNASKKKNDIVIDLATDGDLAGADSGGKTSGRRESRKLNFLGGMWNRKMSPLYLVNGTVCRFINNAPICTTLSTTGILPAGNRPATQGVSGQEGSVVQFDRPPAQNQQNQPANQRPRPAAILDDDSQDINVERLNGSTNDSRIVRGQSQPSQNHVPNVQATRPMNFVASRRPLNLLALRRPVRHQSAQGSRSRDTHQDSMQSSRRGGREISQQV